VFPQLPVGDLSVDCPSRRRSVAAIVAIFLLSGSSLLAEPVDPSQARLAAGTFLRVRSAPPGKARGTLSAASEDGAGTARTAGGLREIRDDDGTLLAYVTDLQPHGFVAMSADTDITPVIAYSFDNPFPADGDESNPLYRMLREDLRRRIQALAETPELKTAETGDLWASYIGAQAEGPAEGEFQQWPPEGTTTTGGWVETTWDQAAPYNQFCPLDPVDHARSYVGCAATALAQLMNYHQRCVADFSSADAYTTYGGMQIDADSTLYDFPSFAQLNGYLDAIRATYSRGAALSDVEAAALSFACGVASQMEYSSLGSGAGSSDVRYALLGNLGFHSADMFGGLSAEACLTIQENIINRLPVLMGICTPDGLMGHMLICDGCNTNNEYHLNFGWGADSPERMTEAWYRLPIGLRPLKTVISDTIVNIRPVEPDLETDLAFMYFDSAPGEQSAAQNLRIFSNTPQLQILSIQSSDGFVITRNGNGFSNRLAGFTLQQKGEEATIKVRFSPERAGGYYGTLVIQYGNGNTKYVILKGWAYTGGTLIPAGNVFGMWMASRSPYFVAGNIEVTPRAELVIEPGVKVFFLGAYGMTVGMNARLTARGTADQPIEITAWNKEGGWGGLRFIGSGNDDVLRYCSITHARKGAGAIPESPYIVNPPEGSDGGAIYCLSSNPTIENCRITNNIGDMGGAVYCIESSPTISNTLIANNTSLGGRPRCGGICCDEWGLPELRNCTIVHNSPGGILSTSWQGIDVTNTIVWGNELYQIEMQECAPTVSFCDVQGGYQGEGNMDVDPCFFDPSAGAGIDYDGASANWGLQTCSPCVNSGTAVAGLPTTDLAGGSRVHSQVVDVGAYENQSDLPLLTISPSTSIDAGFTQADAESAVQFIVENTGTGDFLIQELTVTDPDGAFSLSPPVQDYILSPGASLPVEVTFRPQEERSYAGILSLRSTADNGAHRQVTLHGTGVRGTIIPGPSVSGTWTRAQSPYVITGDIRIPRNRTLTIEPGVVVRFAGRFRFTVGYRATLRAIGTEQDGILFTALDPARGWAGIRFFNGGADDTLRYCTIEHSRKPSTDGGSFIDLFGGAILCCSPADEEPGFPVMSSPTIDSCLFRDNSARTGGAIMCTDSSTATITNNTIVGNTAEIDGAAIALYYAFCQVANNVIAHNAADVVAGGLMNYLSTPAITNNTFVANRPSALHLEATMSWSSLPEACPVVNNIIWNNEIFMAPDVRTSEYRVEFNDIQGGWQGTGNIDVDPWFVDPAAGDYHLKSEAGRWDPVTRSWVIDDVTSPCIDAGNPQSSVGDEPQPNGRRIDMGAYGGTDQAGRSPYE
jgi:hypothetical protein